MPDHSHGWIASNAPVARDIRRVMRFGRIAIANSDAVAAAYTDRASDEAYRAVNEILSV